jgi:hypothetical protein
MEEGMESQNMVRDEEIYALAEEVAIGAWLTIEGRHDMIYGCNVSDATLREILIQDMAGRIAGDVRSKILSTDIVRIVEAGGYYEVSADCIFMSRARFLSSIRNAVRRLLDEHRITKFRRLDDDEGDCSLCEGAKMVTRSGERVPCPLCEETGKRIPREDLEEELVMYRERHLEGK